MPTPIDRDRVRELLDQGAQLVSVLPESDYEYEHLPDAIRVPLKTLDAQRARRVSTSTSR